MPESTTETGVSTVPAAPTDPYALHIEDVREAPTTLRGRLRYLGPGFILSAAVVGSGELIVTTSMGAQAGFALLWLVIISTGVKVWVQMELARWTILNGRPALEGYREVGPRIGRVSWINWLWIGMDFAKMFQRGGIIGGTAAAFSILWPITGEALSFSSLRCGPCW
jgi:Mn2+/Fe2+ NRAMP family transporter